MKGNIIKKIIYNGILYFSEMATFEGHTVHPFVTFIEAHRIYEGYSKSSTSSLITLLI